MTQETEEKLLRRLRSARWLLIISLIATVAGVSLLWYATDWRVPAAVILMLWGVNLERRADKITAEVKDAVDKMDIREAVALLFSKGKKT